MAAASDSAISACAARGHRVALLRDRVLFCVILLGPRPRDEPLCHQRRRSPTQQSIDRPLLSLARQLTDWQLMR
jgi:hypothetical protein